MAFYFSIDLPCYVTIFLNSFFFSFLISKNLSFIFGFNMLRMLAPPKVVFYNIYFLFFVLLSARYISVFLNINYSDFLIPLLIASFVNLFILIYFHTV